MDLKATHESLLLDKGFTRISAFHKYNQTGTCYMLDPSLGEGYYWMYSYQNLFCISIHDFYFNEDYYYESRLPEFFSITYYESLSGEELNPYQPLKSGCVKSLGSKASYQAIFHKKIPIKSIGIEFTPQYCDEYLARKYADDYINPRSALLSINETTNFPEMVLLLHQLQTYQGTGMPAKLFYEGKAAEAISLIFERERRIKTRRHSPLSNSDLKHLENVAAHINDHYAFSLTLKQLSKIACMGTTKLKTAFKELYNCTITEYIQQRRMRQAQQLLTHTDLTIKEIALKVGYRSAGRLSELFKRSTGITPIEYRKLRQPPSTIII